MSKLIVYVGAAVVALLTILGLALLMALPTYWLWNWLMPGIFHLPLITFWQALGLNLLSGMLLKSSVSVKK